MAWWNSVGFQDSASSLMEQLVLFHDHSMVIVTLIMFLVGIMMVSMVLNLYVNRFLLESQVLEVLCTIIPIFILIFIALPSLRLLYLLDEINEPEITIKAVGHQWYCSYEYSDFGMASFDSYMIMTEEISESGFRLLEVDRRVVLPFKVDVRGLISAEDVIHAYSVPSLGVKVDAIPGRLNQISFNINRAGVFFGQCSEICGANHSFMPIVLESVSVKDFFSWVIKY